MQSSSPRLRSSRVSKADGHLRICYCARSPSCFTSTFHAIAGYARFEYTDLEAEVEGVVSKIDSGYSFSEIVLRPSLTIPCKKERERAVELLQKAKALCLVSRALATAQKFETKVEVSDGFIGRLIADDKTNSDRTLR